MSTSAQKPLYNAKKPSLNRVRKNTKKPAKITGKSLTALYNCDKIIPGLGVVGNSRGVCAFACFLSFFGRAHIRNRHLKKWFACVPYER